MLRATRRKIGRDDGREDKAKRKANMVRWPILYVPLAAQTETGKHEKPH
jgi:hypothetical protein